MALKQWLIVAANRIATRLWAFCVRRKIVRYEQSDMVREITDGASWETFWKSFTAEFSSRFFYAPRNRKDFFLQTMQRLHPYEEILDDANAAAARTFDLLGSGPVTLATPLAWNVDFKTGAAWKQTFYTDVERANDALGGDIKIPWELGRFHYLVWLGKGYWASNSRRYVDAFRALIDEWVAANPMPYGVQWDNAMEVALRACNWIAGMAFMLDEPMLDAAFWQRMLAMLWTHAEFIEDNLEITRRSGNHLIADYTGLAFVGSVFSHTIEGRRWLVEGVRGIEREIVRQTSADGVDYEQSIAYHRFVAEMALAVLLLARHTRVPFDEEAAARIEDMCAFTLAYTRPDGSAPNIGDNDNGRLFRVRSEEHFLDHTALLSTAAVVFQRADFKAAAGRFAEETLWLTGTEGWERFMALGTTQTRASIDFPRGGFYILRSETLHCIVDVGELGKHGWGGHGHNDTLGFELWRGAPVIVDSGTFCYTADRAQRDAFRGTAAHNTAMIDGVEIAEFKNAFKVKSDRTRPVVRGWKTDGAQDRLDAAHFAYTRLNDAVTHARRFTLDKRSDTITIIDTFECHGAHDVHLFLHFAPDIAIEQRDDGSLDFSGTFGAGTLRSSHPWTIEPSWYSPSYGIRTANLCATCRMTIRANTQIETTLTFS